MNFKKTISIFLSLALMFQLFSLSTFANSKNDIVDEAVSFFLENNIIYGDILNTELIDSGVSLEVNYLKTGENSTINYQKFNNEEVTITIIEPQGSDTIVFHNDGTVKLNGRNLNLTKKMIIK